MKKAEATTPTVTQEWINSVVGRDWEIFWKQDDTDENEQNEDANDQVEQDEEDWYAARIEGLTSLTKPKRNSSSKPEAVFQVCFVGDEEIYEMSLTPDIVRPCARAWIRRTKAILESHDSDVSPGTNLRDSLPSDTRRLEDAELLEQTANETNAKFETMEEFIAFSGNATENDFPSWNEMLRIRELVLLIREQVSLRHCLATIDNTPESRSSSDEEQEPSEDYLNYLVQCLETLEGCCWWYDRCYVLFSRIHHSEPRSCNPIPRGQFLESYLEGAKQVVADLLSLDPTPMGLKRKRSLHSNASTAGSRRTKRRRRGAASAEFWSESETGERTIDPDLSMDDFLSSKVVELLVERLAQHDMRWYSLCFGRMIRGLSQKVILPLVRWERQSEFCLGERDAITSDGNDGEAYEGAAVGDEGDARDIASNRNSGKWMKFEDVEALVKSWREDPVISRVDFSEIVIRLEQKLTGITDFEEQCWTLIEAVLEDADTFAGDEKSDTTLEGLQNLLRIAQDQSSPVFNVEPFGRGESPLTRKVVGDAIVCRVWYADLRRAETVRERASFVKSITTRMSNLPLLPARAASENAGMTNRLREMTPRVELLCSFLEENVALFERHECLLADRQPSEGDLLERMNEVLDTSVQELRRTPVICVAEEMACTRSDIVSWLSDSTTVLGGRRPSFSEITRIKLELDNLLAGKSKTRAALVGKLKTNVAVEQVVKDFAKADISAFCETNSRSTLLLYSSSSHWKERCELILTALRHYGNSSAGEGHSVSGNKTPAQVDLKRIDDLLREYEALGVTLEPIHGTIQLVYDEATAWTRSIYDKLSQQELSFAQVYEILEAAGEVSSRPRGLIVDPTRHVLDLSLDLLRWYEATRKLPTDDGFDRNGAFSLLVEGNEVIELFSRERKRSDQFLPETKELLASTYNLLDTRKPIRILAVSKLQSHPIPRKLLSSMIIDSRDQREGFPLFKLLHVAWLTQVETYAKSFLSNSDHSGSNFSLESASALAALQPRAISIDAESPAINVKTQWSSEFTRIMKDAQDFNEKILQTFGFSKGLLKGCLLRVDEITKHISTMKDHLIMLRRDFSGTTALALPRSLETQLDREIRLFGWLNRALQYQPLKSEFTNDIESKIHGDLRIPWDALIKIFETRPDSNGATGDFACVLLRVKELYDNARSWQEEISRVTMLSLRGGKRRTIPGKGTESEEEQSLTKIDVAKVAQLSSHPILLKVAMPREDAVKNMLTNTTKFENLLQDFLGKDYDGFLPDKANFPLPGSLVDEDGTFILYRLTCSPLFIALKISIKEISGVAEDVLAETPGKATFDWITRAVDWIDSLNLAVVRMPLNSGRLSILGEQAMELWKSAEANLLDVPDDLRRTLSKHGIFVSTNKEGKLTVKSKKGAAQNAVGTTVIRWSPLLFESLKEDIAKTQFWENRYTELARDYKSHDLTSLSMFSRAWAFREDFSELVNEAQFLVVFPAKGYIEAAQEILQSLNLALEKDISPAVATESFHAFFEEPPSVVDDRFLLLDALVDRAALERPKMETGLDELSHLPFRPAARLLIQRALVQGLNSAEISTTSSLDADGLCMIRAWEIEVCLYETYQENGGTKIASSYREKARALKRALEDCCNVPFCLKVLFGEISVDDIVRMSSDELANPQTLQNRESIMQAAVEKSNLTRNSLSKEEEDEDEKMKASIPQSEVKANGAREAVASSIERSEEEVLDKPEDEDVKPAARTKARERTTRVSGPPPPPPSLVGLRRSTRQSSGKTVASKEGSSEFSISAEDITFSVSFTLETGPKTKIEKVIPKTLLLKGRSKVEEVGSFVSQKKASDNWSLAVLRLNPLTQVDTKQHKLFRKNLEGRKRIAMFRLSDTAKLFLMTPIFHKHFANILPEQSTSTTYGVLLMRA